LRPRNGPPWRPAPPPKAGQRANDMPRPLVSDGATMIVRCCRQIREKQFFCRCWAAIEPQFAPLRSAHVVDVNGWLPARLVARPPCGGYGLGVISIFRRTPGWRTMARNSGIFGRSTAIFRPCHNNTPPTMGGCGTQLAVRAVVLVLCCCLPANSLNTSAVLPAYSYFVSCRRAGASA
jgi:hypothetical protein